MKYKVLIKGLGSNIKEEKWELNNNQVARFVDDTGTAYAIQFFQSGQSQYRLVSKKFWDNKEEFVLRCQSVTLDSNLSNEKKDEEISKIFLELS